MDYSEVEEAGRVGFIFDPSDEEMASFYLKGMAGDRNMCFPGFIHRLDIYESQPWNLLPPHEFKYGISKNEAFFFTPRYPCSSSTSSTSSKSHVRRTVSRGNDGGFWHGKAHDIPIRQSGEVIGRKTSLHFKTTKGIPTDWIMQEYILVDKSGAGRSRCTTFQSVALCKIYKKTNSSKRPYHLHLHDENKVFEEAEPPCKKQRTQLLLHQDDHIDHEVDHGYSTPAVEASSTCWLPPPSSPGDWNCASNWDMVVVSGQSSTLAPECPISDAAVITTLACNEEEIQVPAEVAAVADCSPNEMFSFTQLLGEEEEEEVVVPAAALHDEPEEEFPFLAKLLREENIITAEDDEFCVDDYLCLDNCC